MIDRKEIKKIVLKGGLNWSDIAPSESSFDYNSEKQRSSDEDETARREAASRKEADANEEIEANRKANIKKEELVPEKKSNKASNSDIELGSLSPKGKESYNFLNWTADSYKTLILKKNQSQIGASNGYIKHFLAPAKMVKDAVYENRNNPEFINYVKTIDSLSKKESDVSPELKSVLNNRSLTDTQRREEYEKQLRYERATRDRGLLEPGGVGQFVGETLKRVGPYLSDPRKLAGDIYQLFDNDQTILPTTQAEILADRAREYGEAEEAISLAKNGEYGKLAMKYNPYSNAFRSSNRFGNEYAIGTVVNAGLGIASTGARGAMAIKDVAGAALTNVVAGGVAYKTSKYVNGNNGYRDILDIEVPENMKEAHTKYWDVVSEWSKLGGDYSIPDIKDVVDGNPIGDKWAKESDDKMAKEYAEKLEDVSRDRADMAHLKFMGINIDQPTERAIKEAEEQGTWFNTIGNVGMSVGEAGAQASIAGLSMAVNMAASKMARVGKYSPIAISAIANIATSLPNAYVSRMMRENEYATSLDQNFNQKQDAYLKSIGKPAISDIADADLLASISAGQSKDAWSKEFMQTGKLSTDSRADLELALRTGMVKTTNGAISESIKKANLGTDESARQYMSMIYSDMADNAITALPFYFKGVSNFKAGGSAISKAFGHAAEDYSSYLYKSKAGMFFNNTKTGKALSIAGQMAGRSAGNVASELFLEENPQYVIDQKYINGELRDNPNAISVLKDTYASAITGFQGLLGVSGDHRYDDKDSDIHNGLVDNAIATVWSTLLQGSAANIITTAGQTRAAIIDSYAKNFVNGTVVNQMKMSNREAKTDVYVKAMSADKMDAVIDNLQSLRQNLPEGITDEEIENEIKLAKKTIAIANSKGVKAYANASAGFGSSDHKLLTSLIVDHIDSKDAATEFAKENDNKFMDVVDSEMKDSSLYTALSKANPEISEAAIKEAYIAAARLEAIKTTMAPIKSRNDERALRMNSYLFDEKEALKAKITNLTGLKESEIDELPGSESSEIFSLYKSSISKAGAYYDSVMVLKLSGVPNSTKHLAYIDKKLEDYRSSRKSEERFDEKIESAVDIARAEAASTVVESNDQIVDEPIIIQNITDEPIITDPVILMDDPTVGDIEEVENKKEDKLNKEEDIDAAALIEEANSIISKGAKATGNEQTGSTREDSSDRQADRGDTDTTKDKSDKEEANRVDQGEDTFEDSNSKINKDAASSVSESGVIEEILEDEDSSQFYEIEDEFPGATESAKEDQKRDKLSRTLFSADKKTHEFLSKPDALDDAEVIITVSRIPDANVPKNRRDPNDVNPYNKPFFISDKSTWNEAWIEIEIKSKKYGNFKLNVSLPDQAAFRSFKTLPGGQVVPKFSKDEIDALILFRENIISEYKKVFEAEGKKKLISVGGIARGKAKIALNRLNGMAVQRGLHKIAGMIDGFTGKNFNVINNDTLKLAYARGSKGIYDIVGLYGTYGYTVEQNSGNMFVVKQDPITGENRNIKINKKRFKDDESMIDLIYRLAVDMGASAQQITINKEGNIELVTPGAIAELGITANGLLNKIVTFGQKTIVTPSERHRFGHLVKKQFYIDGTTLHYGDNAIDISNSSMISPDQKKEITDFIRENLHWTISKEDLWNPSGNDNLVANLFPQLRDYFKNNNKKSVKFADGFIINDTDLDLTWAAWIVKNEKLISDTGDGVFEAPYTYLNDVRAVDVVKRSNVLKPAEEPLKTPENASESTPTDVVAPTDDKPAKKKSLFQLKSSKKINIGGKPRLMSDSQFAKMQEDEIAWIKSRLTSPEIVGDVIDVAGEKAMGLTTSSSIILYNGAESGTAYHEAFHFVSLLLSNRNRRMAMYEQVRTSVDGMKDATNSEIEEYLAENFREWMMTNRSKQKASMVKSLFRKMREFVSSTRNLTKSDIDRIYRNIDLGIYKSSKIDKRSRREFQINYERGATKLLKDKKFKYIDTVDLQYSVVDGLTCYLFDIFGVNSVNDVSKLDVDELKEYIEGSIDDLIKAGKDQKIIGIYNDVLENFDSEFKPMIEAKLATFGIINSGVEEQDQDSNILGDELRRYYKADYEISKRDNIPFEIKFFLSTIFKFKRNDDGSLESVDNPQTLMKEFVDSNIAWKKLIDELKDELTPESMFARIDMLAVNSTDPFYASLKNKIDEFYKGDVNFATKLWSSMYSHRHQFVNFAYSAERAPEDNSNLNKIIESKLGDARTIMPKIWGENVVSGGVIFTNTEDGYVFNSEAASGILERFTALSKNANRILSQKISLNDAELTDMLSELSSLLNAIGINIDNRVLEAFIDSNIKNEPKTRSIPLLITRVDSTFPSIIFTNIISGLINNDGKLIVNKREKSDLKTIYQSQKSIMKLAEANARVHTTPTEATSTGADGSTVYEIALRNYILDMFTKLKKGSEILGKMLGVVSNKNSIVLNQINEGLSSGVKVKTFLKMYQELSGDKGRDYFDISKVEDYIMKMTAILDGMMVSPAMADKKSYYLFDGINMPDFISNPISYSEQTGRMSIPSNVLNIFNGYFKDEYESIKSGWNDYVAVKGNKKLLEEVYHYGGVDWRGGSKYATKGKWNSGLGNGLHFRHFDIIRISTPEGSYDVNLNEVMEEFISNFGKEDGMNAFFTFMDKNYFGESVEHSTRLTTMQNTLKSGIFSEMKWAATNGIIVPENGGKSFSNIKLDKALFNKMYEQYLVSAGQDGTVSSANTAAVLNLMSANYINTAISIIEFEKLITKDPAFYKDPDAKMKRHSSMLSTGTNVRSDFPAGHELHGKTTYTSAELMDNEIPSVEIESIRKNMVVAQINELFRQNGKEPIPNLIDIYGTAEYDTLKEANKAVFNAAEKLVEKSIDGYDNNGINETDATAFVSPEMYRSILIRKGKWNDELDEAFKLLMSDDTSWMADDEKYLKVMEIATNPLKMIYYGDSFKGNLNVPKLNKMALFCLMKPVATGDLSVLYDRMNNPKDGLGKLDMVIFSSAVKVGNHNALSFYNEDGSIADMGNLSPDTQYFEYLRDQLVTDPHHESNIDLATQVQKISMSNVDRARTYGNITIDGKRGATGDRILSDYRDSIVELSNRGVKKVLKKLGIKSNSDGTIGAVDQKELYKFLSEEAVKSGMPSDVVEMLSNYDPSGDMTIQGMFDDKWIEAKIVSDVLKKTIDVETPGGMFIQMTPFGLAKTSSDENDLGYKLNDGKRLRFVNEDGSMDAVISMSLFKDILPKDIKSKSHIAQRDWLISNGIIGRDSDPIAIGYRIPTQGMPSVSYLKIVDVMPVNIGDTIMLPTEFTKLTGSDFDVDKLYIARYNYESKDGVVGRVKFNDSVEDRFKGNSEKAIQNRIIDCMAAIISDPDSFMEARMPLDTVTDKLKNDILKHIDSFSASTKSNSPLRFISPSYHTDKKVEYSTGKRNLGPFALAITHHILTQISNLQFSPSKVLSKHGITDVSSVMGRDGVKTLDWLSAMVSAHVDIAKDPYIIRLGINNYTIKMAALMLRSGVGANTFYFLSQPAMKKYCDALDASAGKYQISGTAENERAVLESIIREYKSELSNYADSDLKKRLIEGLENVDKNGRKDIATNGTLDIDRLVSGLGNNNKDNFFRIYNQILVLETYSELSPYANELGEAVKYSQVDTKKGGSTFSEQSEFLRGVNRLISDNSGNNSIFSNIRSLFDNTFIYAKLLNSAGLIGEIGKGLLFRTSNSISNTINSIMAATGRIDRDNSQLIKSVSNYINAILKSEFFNKYAEDNKINISDLFFGEATLAKELYKIKSGIKSGIYKELENNEFISNITYSISNNRTMPDHITVINNSGTADVNVSEKIRNYFDELLNSSNEKISLFAKKFIVYQFFSTGDNSAINTIKLSEYTREQIGLHKYIKDKLDSVNDDSFSLTPEEIAEIFENRWMDNDLVPTKENRRATGNYFFNDMTQRMEDEYVAFPTIQSTENISKSGAAKFTGNTYPLAFVDEKPTNSNMVGSLGESSLFIPYIKQRIAHKNGESSYVLYKLGGQVTEMKTGRIFPVYVAVDKKGSKESGLSIIEHGLSEQSIVKSNILPQKITVEDILSIKNNPITSKYGSIAVVDPISDIIGYGEEQAFEDIVLGRSDLDRIVDASIASGDYSLTNLRELTSSMDNDTANVMYSDYAKAILRRSDELLRNSDEYLQASDESVLEELKMRLEAYLQQFIQDEPIITEVTMTQNESNTSGFQGYVGGFENTGKGTVDGDGKDKAMRQVADGFIGEITKANSSSMTSFNELRDSENKSFSNGTNSSINNSQVVMLARNSEYSGAELLQSTKDKIDQAFNYGAEFVVGDMPNVDSQFIEYLQEIGAKFTVYHTGNTPRIDVNVSTEEKLPGSIESVNTTEEYIEHGTRYRFELSNDSSIVKAEYKQGNKEWQPLTNAVKVYKRVSAKNSNVVDAVVETAKDNDSNNVSFAGKSINLSKIGIPFKLNDGQSGAIESISNWVLSDSMEPYAFRGYAGTGKTSVTKIIVAGLLASRTPFKLASFTHGAKRILSRMTGSPAKTIHSLLKMSVNDSSMSVGKKLEFGGARMDDIPYGGVIIIDESSMISDELVDFIVETAAMKHTKVLFIGDKGQIDPPDNRGANGMTIPSKALDYANSFELTEVMRISNGSKLIDSVTSLRNAQNMSLVPQYGEAKLSMFPRRNEYNEIGGALWLGEPARMDMINMMIDEYFLSDAYAADNNFVKFIGWRNSVIDSINELVRKRLGMPGIIATGETVVGQVKVTSNKDTRPMVENGDEYRVTKVSKPYVETVSFLGGIDLEFVDVDIEMVNGESTGGSFKLLNDYSDATIEKIQNAILKKKAAISELYRANRDLGAKESSKFYKELNNGFITLKNIPNPNNMSEKDSDSLKQKAIRHYHAITAHKSQGGEFTNVFVDDSDIRRAAKNTDELSYKKLIYTAVSRAKEKAVIVTNGFRFDKAANKFVDQNEQNTIPVEFRNNSALNKESKTEDRPSDKC